MMDSFGYTLFVFEPLLAILLIGAAWAVQIRANRDIDARLRQAHQDAEQHASRQRESDE
jgi:HAMP domain-containing protein